MLSDRLMRYIDAVARAGSIRKAATHLNVASSAVNRQILALEEALGTQLFERLPRSLRLTAAGEVLVDHIRRTQKSFDRARIVIDQMKGLRRGEVGLAVMSGPSGSILPPVLDGFRRTHPHARISVQVLSGADIVAAVRQGEADIGVAFDLPRERGIRLAVSHGCALGAVVRPGHPLAQRRSLQLDDCEPYPLVVADRSMAIRPYIDALAARDALSLDAAIETNSIEVMRRMTMTSDLVTFLTPIDILLERQDGQLVYVPFRVGTMPSQHLMLVTRDKAVDPLAALLVERFRLMLDQPG